MKKDHDNPDGDTGEVSEEDEQDGGKGSLLSPFLCRAVSNVNEALVALTVTDLPFTANEPNIDRQRGE